MSATATPSATARFNKRLAIAKTGKPANGNTRTRTTASGKKRRHIVVAGRAPELTVTELQKVQDIGRGIENIDAAVRNLYAALRDRNFAADDGFQAQMADINSMIDDAIGNLNKTPKHLRDVINFKDYAKVLDSFDTLFAEAVQDVGDAKSFNKELTRIHARLNNINKANPLLKKTKTGFIVLGASALAAVLVGVGAYFIDEDGRVADLVEKGLNTMGKWADQAVDWVSESVESFRDLIGTARESGLESFTSQDIMNEMQEMKDTILQPFDDLPYPEYMQDMSDSTWDTIGKTAFKWNQVAQDWIGQTWDSWDQMGRAAGDRFMEFTREGLDFDANALRDSIQSGSDAALNTLRGAWEQLSNDVAYTGGVIGDAADSAAEGFEAFKDSVMSKLGEIGDATADFYKEDMNRFSQAWDATKETVGDVGDKLASWWDTLKDAPVNFMRSQDPVLDKMMDFDENADEYLMRILKDPDMHAGVPR